MSAILNIVRMGNHLTVNYADKSKQMLLPTGGAIWIPKNGVESPPPVTGDTGGTTTPPGSAQAPTDDYPWPNGTVNDMSPLRYGYRECVDFVAFRLNRDKGRTSAPWKYTWSDLRPAGGNGDAIGWRGDWLILGWKVDLKPAPGMVAWYGSKAGAYGHVAYVQAVNNGSLLLEEYNWGVNKHAYETRTATPGSAYYPDSFLQAPPG